MTHFPFCIVHVLLVPRKVIMNHTDWDEFFISSLRLAFFNSRGNGLSYVGLLVRVLWRSRNLLTRQV